MCRIEGLVGEGLSLISSQSRLIHLFTYETGGDLNWEISEIVDEK